MIKSIDNEHDLTAVIAAISTVINTFVESVHPLDYKQNKKMIYEMEKLYSFMEDIVDEYNSKPPFKVSHLNRTNSTLQDIRDDFKSLDKNNRLEFIIESLDDIAEVIERYSKNTSLPELDKWLLQLSDEFKRSARLI